MRFLIVAPPYQNSSSGVRVLHRLCHVLNNLGYKASMASKAVNPNWNTPIVSKEDEFDVVVYPEVTHGNPIKAQKVVRYCLNKPGLLGGDDTYADNEMVWYYNHDLKDSAQAAANGREVFWMQFPCFESELFFDRKQERTVDAFYVGKGEKTSFPRWSFEDTGNLVEITKEWPETREDMADFLAQVDNLYSFDNYTGMTLEATRCGCKSWHLNESTGEWYKATDNYYDLDENELVKEFVQKVNAYFA